MVQRGFWLSGRLERTAAVGQANRSLDFRHHPCRQLLVCPKRKPTGDLSGASLRPYEGRNKVFIIDPADALSPGGSNSLLKTLEEPTRDTIFILLTRSPDLLLPTIRSRSQAIYVGGDVQRDEKLASEISGRLKQFAERKEPAALLALASVVADQEDVSQAMALLAEILCEAAASQMMPSIPRERLLAAADASVFGTRWLMVNADPRMLVEQALSALVTGER